MGRGSWKAAVVVCALGGGAARAETDAEAAAEVTAAATLPAPAPETKTEPRKPADAPEESFPGSSKSDRGEDGESDSAAASEPKITVFGRVMARGGADERDEFERQMELSQARLGVKASFGMADAVVEADLSSNSLLRDAYLRLRATEHLRFYGGQFKAPFMQRSLESSWNLPRIGRGLVEEYVVDTHELGGRRLGLMGEAKFKSLRGLRISGGIFQGAEDLDGSRMGEDAAARISVRPFKLLTLATSAYAADIGNGLKRYAGGGDATVSLGHFSITAEALTGQVITGKFTSETAIARYDVSVGSGWVVQPTVSGEALQVRGEENGVAWGGALGLNAILDERFRFQVQAQRMQSPRDSGPNNDVSVQLGARF